MLSLLKLTLEKLRPRSAADRRAALERLENARAVLLLEMKHERIDGRPVTHRRLESLMSAAGTGKRDTIRLLKEIGARPSGRHGTKVWTI